MSLGLGSSGSFSKSAANRWAAQQGVYQASTNIMRGLRRWYALLATASIQAIHANCYGDSITEAVGTEGNVAISDNIIADSKGWPGQLRNLFAAKFGTNPGGLITPKFSGTDTRVSLSGSPTTDTSVITTTYGARLNSSQSFTANLPVCKTADILYYAGGSTDGSLIGGFTSTVDGNASVSLAAGVNASPGYKALNVGALSEATHAVVVTGGHATNTQVIAGVRYHDGKGVTVSRHARSGFTILDLHARGTISAGGISGGTINATTAARVMNFFAAAFGANLNIIAVGENDATKQLIATSAGEYTNLATYEAFLRAMVAAQANAGGCTLLVSWSPPPVGGSAVPDGGATRMAYHAVMKKIASDTDHVAHLDITDIWGVDGDWAKIERYNDGFFSAAATVHPSVLGYGNIASILFRVLTQDWIATE